MIEICPFVAVMEDGNSIDLYAIPKNGIIVYYFLNGKGQAEIFKRNFKVQGFYFQEAKDMWLEKIQPVIDGANTVKN